jgi:hypothetical protein
VDLLLTEMPEYCGCCGRFVWPSGDHQRTGKLAGGPSSEEPSRTSHLRSRCGPLYHQVPSFLSLPLCLKFKHFMIYVIIYILGHVCDVLCINASMLAAHKEPG